MTSSLTFKYDNSLLYTELRVRQLLTVNNALSDQPYHEDHQFELRGGW